MESLGYYDKELMQRLQLEFNLECKKLGFNPNTKLFGFMLLKNLTDDDFEAKLMERYNLWENNLRGMPLAIKQEAIKKAKHELQYVIDTVEKSTNYSAYKQEKLDFLLTFKDKIKDAIHIGKVEPFATWATIEAVGSIFDKVLLKEKIVDPKDRANFMTAFGHGKNSVPFTKIEFNGNEVLLTALLMLMRPKEDVSKYLSAPQKRISNNLFSVELNNKLDEKALKPSYLRLEKIKNMRNFVTPLSFI